MGKTHLLNSIGLSLKDKNSVMFIPAERFMYQFVRSIKLNNMVKFKEYFRNTDILLIDDIQFMNGKEAMQEEFFHTFNALLDMKNFAADIDVASNLIRVHSPSTLTAQESYKAARAAAVKKKVELEDSVEPIISEIFRLYYISPAEAKATVTELFTSTSGTGSFIPIQVTEEKTTRSIIVRGKEKDLDVVDKIISEIDVRTKQVLIEAFIVEADSEFGEFPRNGSGDRRRIRTAEF